MNTQNIKDPPRFGEWLLKSLLPYHTDRHALGDYEEIFHRIVEKESMLKAHLWYWTQILKSIIPFMINSIYWECSMLRNYLVIAFRNLLKQKLYTLITVLGLAVGLGVFLFFFRFFWWALKSDSFHKDADRIYTVVQVFDAGSDDDNHTTDIDYALMNGLKEEIPEIDDMTRMYWPGTMILSNGPDVFYERGMYFADPNFLSFFSFKEILGNTDEMLSQSQSIVLTKPLALKYFGEENPIGKIITVNNRMDVTVTGMLEDVSKTEAESSIRFDFLVSMDVAEQLYGPANEWTRENKTGFVRLIAGADPLFVDKKLSPVLHKHYPDNRESPKRFYLFPITKMAHFTFHIDNYYGSESFVPYVFFLIIGILFLLIVCFNFVNLSTARYTARLKEVGLRKVVGANRTQLIFQFLGESVLLAVLAFPLASICYKLACSAFSAQTGMTFYLELWHHHVTVFVFVTVTLVTGILAGIYPAFFLSSFQPVQSLKNQVKSSGGKSRLRRILVLCQFGISAFLIVMTIVWKKQSDYAYNVDLGYDRHDVMVVRMTDDMKDRIHILKETIKQHPEVSHISGSYSIPGNWGTKGEIIEEGETETGRWSAYVYGVEESFLKVMDIAVLTGKDFVENRSSEINYIVSKMMSERLGRENPVGRKITINGREGMIVGVSEDCHLDDLFYPVAPIAFRIETEALNYLMIELIDVSRMNSFSAYLENLWRTILPEIPFEMQTLDDYFQTRNLRSGNLITVVIGLVGGIAIFFSCLGLLGLASYATRQRTKEIGIRKAVGATTLIILTVLGKDFLKLVIWANLVVFPIAYLVTKELLAFAYKKHVTIGAGVFIMTVFLLFSTAFIAVFTQTLKAARANPVECLRYE